MAQKVGLDRELVKAINALARYGVRFEVHRGELFIDARDTERVIRLCDEGKLPSYVC